MRDWLQRHLIVFGLWLARLGGWTVPVCPPCPRAHIPDVPFDVIRIVSEVEAKHAHQPGVIKSREALRVLLGLYPHQPVRNLNYLIEAAVQARQH
jgi:hypothetical protein